MFTKILSSFSSALFTKTFIDLPAAKKIAYLAVFTAIAVAVNAISIDISPVFKLTFTYVVGFLSGSLFGPIGGFAVMFLGDAVGGFIAGFVPNPIIGIGTGLIGLIPGAIVPYIKCNFVVRLVLSFFLCALICTLGINAYGTYMFVASKYSSYWVYLATRLPQLAVVFVNAFLSYFAVKLLNRSGIHFKIS